ncbi:hypothetical protein MOV08_31115 [Streptomyces yunnanensis]|uniref:Uncharacterized protein n=1 Tax=Streptomyces yunnanensis TaxID=156453 RepID=A0ABY8AIG8_9ACTN|nr:hypothetical protein [Streptomyces yunnanensis]WEB43287.1 hypothetical protein MOV08_31115 [Streptomyces yunnanensis]
MIPEVLGQLAAAGGTALIGAMATDAWHSVRTGFAELLGRGDQGRTQEADRRLENAAAALARADDAERALVRRWQAEQWAGELHALLAERPDAAERLRELVALVPADGGPAARQTFVQHNTAEAGGTQNILQSGTINVHTGPGNAG